MKNQKYSRRYFIQTAIAGLVIGTAVLWDKMVSRQKAITSRKNITIPYNPNLEVSFNDEFIVVTRNNEINVFSSRCTHLGCKINHQSDSKLLCPCHGSSFDLNGDVLVGPALKSLTKHDFELDTDRNVLTIIV